MSPRRTSPGIRRRVWPTGTVTFEISWYDASRKRHYEAYDTFAAADAARAEHLRDRRRGESADPTGARTTLAGWYDKWSATRRVTSSTRAREETIWRCQIEPAFGEVKLGRLVRSDVERWVGDLEHTLAPGTVTRCMTLLHKLLADAMSDGLIGRNVASNVKGPRERPTERRFLSLEELDRLEEAMPEHWRLVVPVAATTGLRIGELAALQVSDLNLGARELLVRRTAVGVPKRVSKNSAYRELHTPKSARGARTVQLIDDIADRLARHVDERGLSKDDLVFAGSQGGPMTPDHWRTRVWRPAVKRARLVAPAPTPHALRHTCAALWLSAGVPLYVVARQLGHSVGVCEHTYGHLLAADHRETVMAFLRGESAPVIQLRLESSPRLKPGDSWLRQPEPEAPALVLRPQHQQGRNRP